MRARTSSSMRTSPLICDNDVYVSEALARWKSTEDCSSCPPTAIETPGPGRFRLRSPVFGRIRHGGNPPGPRSIQPGLCAFLDSDQLHDRPPACDFDTL